jgi:ABC-type polysaccharide/polyol phosphate export permease
MHGAFYTAADAGSIRRLPRDLIRARELLLGLVSKELRVRYRVAALGFFWAVLHPLLMVGILTLVFGYILGPRVGMDTDGQSYPVFLLCALVPWQFFAQSLNSATNSLVDNRDLIKKVYFPREVVPLSSTLDWAVNFLIGVVLLLIAHLIFGGRLGAGIFWFAPIFAIEFALAAGLGLLFSALNARFRDVRYIVEVAVAFGFYVTPVFYPINLARENLSPALFNLYRANPMAGIVTAYRSALFADHVAISGLLWPACAAILALGFGAWVFRRNAITLADYL